MSFGEGIKAFNWITARIDQVSNFIQRKGRQNEVSKINKAVDGNDDVALADKLQRIKAKADARKDARDS